MGAAATAIPREIREAGYTAIPNSFIDDVAPACSRAEIIIMMNVLKATVGGKDRPEWARIPREELARRTNVTIDGVDKALQLVERKRLIESRSVGRTREYRAAVGNFKSVLEHHPPTRRRIQKKPIASASAAHIAPAISAKVRSSKNRSEISRWCFGVKPRTQAMRSRILSAVMQSVSGVSGIRDIECVSNTLGFIGCWNTLGQRAVRKHRFSPRLTAGKPGEKFSKSEERDTRRSALIDRCAHTGTALRRRSRSRAS